MRADKAFKLAASILICLLAGFIGQLATGPAITGWYSKLVKPPLQPPNWVFAPVWTILYIMMGVALYLVIADRKKWEKKSEGVFAFAFQLALNSFWSVLFFGYHLPSVAAIEIIALWSAILGTILLFDRVSRTAAILMMPYLIWVTFATYLNFAIWWLNR